MNTDSALTYVDRVISDAQLLFGKTSDRVRIEQVARDAVATLLSTAPVVTDYIADLALRQVRETLRIA